MPSCGTGNLVTERSKIMKELKLAFMVVAATAIACVGKSEVWQENPPVIEGGGIGVFEVSGCEFSLCLGEGVSSVTWSWTAIGRSKQSSTINSNYHESRVSGGFTVSISSVEYKDWYVPDGDCKAGWSRSVGAAEPIVNITVGAKRIYKKANDDGSISVAPDATPDKLGFTSGYFSRTGTDITALADVLTWCSRKNGDADEAVNEMSFSDSGTPESLAAEAYLLNCAATSNAVCEAKAAFRFDSFDSDTVPTKEHFADMNYNGSVLIKGAVALGEWHDVTEAGKIVVDGVEMIPRFFKAQLRYTK